MRTDVQGLAGVHTAVVHPCKPLARPAGAGAAKLPDRSCRSLHAPGRPCQGALISYGRADPTAGAHSGPSAEHHWVCTPLPGLVPCAASPPASAARAYLLSGQVRRASSQSTCAAHSSASSMPCCGRKRTWTRAMDEASKMRTAPLEKPQASSRLPAPGAKAQQVGGSLDDSNPHTCTRLVCRKLTEAVSEGVAISKRLPGTSMHQDERNNQSPSRATGQRSPAAVCAAPTHGCCDPLRWCTPRPCAAACTRSSCGSCLRPVHPGHTLRRSDHPDTLHHFSLVCKAGTALSVQATGRRTAC